MSISITNFDCKVNQIEVLKQTELCGHQFTVYGTAENPLFLAKEIAECIEHSNITVMLQTIDEEEKVKITPKQSLGDLVNYKEYNFLTEDGLYEVLMQSRKPIAKDFKKGVKEILKTIRKTGGYLATTQEDTPELIMARALQVAQMTIERHQQQLQDAQTTIAEQSKELEAAKPAVIFTTTVQGAKTSILIGELAKLITQSGHPIGQNRMFEWLRKNGYLGKKGSNYNVPMQKYVEMGLFEIKEGTRSGSNGVMHITKTTKVTGKGQVYFVNKFIA